MAPVLIKITLYSPDYIHSHRDLTQILIDHLYHPNPSIGWSLVSLKCQEAGNV